MVELATDWISSIYGIPWKMKKNHNGRNKAVYLLDEAGRVSAVSDYGLQVERETGKVAGGGMFDWPSDDSKPSSVVVLMAPSMPFRFKAFEITDSDTFLIRTDDVRCQVTCDPLLADGLACQNTIVVTEASGQNDGGNLSYEVVIYSDHMPTMRM